MLRRDSPASVRGPSDADGNDRFRGPRSLFRERLEHAGVRFPDAVDLVARLGLDGALEAWYE